MSEQNICPVCNQKREKLVLLSNINERFHGVTVSRGLRYIDKICFSCRKKAEKELKKKGSAKLIGDNFSIIIFGYLKYLDRIKRDLKLPRSFYDQAIIFIKNIYFKFEKNIANIDKIKYYFAGILMLLQERKMNEKKELLIQIIKENYTNVSIKELNNAIEEIKNWCNNNRISRPFNFHQK